MPSWLAFVMFGGYIIWRTMAECEFSRRRRQTASVLLPECGGASIVRSIYEI